MNIDESKIAEKVADIKKQRIYQKCVEAYDQIDYMCDVIEDYLKTGEDFLWNTIYDFQLIPTYKEWSYTAKKHLPELYKKFERLLILANNKYNNK